MPRGISARSSSFKLRRSVLLSAQDCCLSWARPGLCSWTGHSFSEMCSWTELTQECVLYLSMLRGAGICLASRLLPMWISPGPDCSHHTSARRHTWPPQPRFRTLDHHGATPFLSCRVREYFFPNHKRLFSQDLCHVVQVDSEFYI